MRKLFIGTMLVSLLGAAVVGAVLAWTGSTPPSGQDATAGSVEVAVWGVSDTGNPVVPSGSAIKVATGGIENNGDIAVHVTGGTVTNIDTTPDACNNDLSGSVTVTDPSDVAPNGGTDAPLYDVFLTMATSAEDDCQGEAITYDLTIDVES